MRKLLMLLTTLSVVALTVTQLPQAIGQLMARFGMSWGDALATVAFIAQAGYWGAAGIAALFPWIIPVLGTVEGLIMFAGISAAAGW